MVFYLILAGLFLVYRYRIRQIKEKEAVKLAYDRRAMEAELKTLRSQMNPHFLFNSLNSIKHYIARQEPRSAADYLTKFARLMRKILNNSHTSQVSFSSEMEAIELYLQFLHAFAPADVFSAGVTFLWQLVWVRLLFLPKKQIC